MILKFMLIKIVTSISCGKSFKILQYILYHYRGLRTISYLYDSLISLQFINHMYNYI